MDENVIKGEIMDVIIKIVNYINESGLKSQIFFQGKPYIIDIQINNKFTKNYTIFYQSAN